MKISTGTIIDGRYEILSELGEGGMGTVYSARETELGRVVALKFLQLSSVTDEEYRARFEREAEICAALQHEHINVFYRLGFWQNQIPYISMEYLEGRSLRQLLDAESRLHWRRACKIVASIADAMEAAHKQGVVHRDLKPNNVMLIPTPTPDFVKVMDFGLARIAKAEPDVQKLTQTGALIGSVSYMSPEMCRGEKADHRSDIYSLGCVLFECIAGEPPFAADNPIGLLHLHAHEYQRALTSFTGLSDLPPGLDQVLATALAKESSKRYQTMSEFRDELMRLLDGQAPLTEQSIPVRNRPKKKLAFITALILLVPVVGWTLTEQGASSVATYLVQRRLLSPPTAMKIADYFENHGRGSAAADIKIAAAEIEELKHYDIRAARLEAEAAKIYLARGDNEKAARWAVAAARLLFAQDQHSVVSAEERGAAMNTLDVLVATKPKEDKSFILSFNKFVVRYASNADLREKTLRSMITLGPSEFADPSIYLELAKRTHRSNATESRSFALFGSKLLDQSELRKTIFGDQTRTSMRLSFADLLVSLGDVKAARAILEKLPASGMASCDAVGLASICWRLGQVPRAKQIFKMAEQEVFEIPPGPERDQLAQRLLEAYLSLDQLEAVARLTTRELKGWSSPTDYGNGNHLWWAFDSLVKLGKLEQYRRELDNGCELGKRTMVGSTTAHCNQQTKIIAAIYEGLGEEKKERDLLASTIRRWSQPSDVLIDLLAFYWITIDDKLTPPDDFKVAFQLAAIRLETLPMDSERNYFTYQMQLIYLEMGKLADVEAIALKTMKLWKQPVDADGLIINELMQARQSKKITPELEHPLALLEARAKIGGIEQRNAVAYRLSDIYLTAGESDKAVKVLSAAIEQWQKPEDFSGVDFALYVSTLRAEQTNAGNLPIFDRGFQLGKAALEELPDGRQRRQCLNSLLNANLLVGRPAEVVKLARHEFASWKDPLSFDADAFSTFLRALQVVDKDELTSIEVSRLFRMAEQRLATLPKQKERNSMCSSLVYELTHKLNEPAKAAALGHSEIARWREPDDVEFTLLQNYANALLLAKQPLPDDVPNAVKLAEIAFTRLRVPGNRADATNQLDDTKRCLNEIASIH